MSHFPLVTVGITCYNDERFVRDCLESVLNQSYPNLEIIVVDDHSTDSSLDILHEYDNRFKTIRHEANTGSLLQGRIDVITNATGDYIAHLDADDFWHPNFVEKITGEFTIDPQLDWVVGNTNLVNSAGFTINQWSYDDYPTEMPACIKRGFKTASLPFPNNGIFKTSFLRKNDLTWYRLPNTLQGEDAITSIKYLECNPVLRHIPVYFFNYRLHGSNMSYRPAERVKMVIDLKEYYFRSFDSQLLFDDARLNGANKESTDYKALLSHFFAKDLNEVKSGMKIPAAFSNDDIEEELLDSLHLFNVPIEKYAHHSLSLSNRYENEVREILAGLKQSDAIINGRKQLMVGNLQIAEKQFASVMDGNGQIAEALSGLGEVYYCRGELAKAEEFTAQAVQANPNSPEVLNNAGVIFSAKNEPTNSIQALLKAISYDPHSANPHVNFASVAAKFSKDSFISEDLRKQLIGTVKWLSNNYSDNSREQLLIENWQLAKQVVDKHRNIFAGTSKKIMIQQPDNGALKYLMQAWCDVLEHMGIKTAVLKWTDTTRSQLNKFNPDVFITVNDKAYLERIDMPCINEWRKFYGLQLGLILSYDQPAQDADFLITFHRDPQRHDELSRTDLPLLSLPFAANPLVHFMRPGRELWDYFFVGTNSAMKRSETSSYLEPVINNYVGILAGVNWPSGIGELEAEEASLFYSFGRVCPNYHVMRQIEEFNEVNDRTFIIPACGGFEIVDNPKAMKGLFSSDEMPVAQTPQEYHDMFRYYLERPDERQQFIQNGMRRVFREYTLFHIMSRLAEFLGISETEEYSEPTSTNKALEDIPSI